MNRTFVLMLFILVSNPFNALCQLKLIPVFPVNDPAITNKEAVRTMASDTLKLPFWDDFSTYEGTPDPNLWLEGSGVYVNKTLAINPPTMGVATFDGATGNGGIYNADPNRYGLADSLVSKPINLGTLTSTEVNTVYLSFFWEFFGISEIPDVEDSLQLLFKNQQNIWEVVDVFDKTRVTANDTFMQVIYKLAPRFLHGSFQFKFNGYARLSGPFDAWHIDYVYLDKNRSIVDKTYFDRAISTLPDYLFKGYSAMPINQFFSNPDKYLASSFIDIYNLDNLLQPIEYSAIITNTFDSNEVIDVLNFNTEVNPILQGQTRRSLYANQLDYSKLDSQADSIYMTLTYYISSGDSIQDNGINYRINDTTTANFTLHDYYATDDGTAEFGLGLEQKGGKIAYMFVLEEPDVLNAVELSFPNIGRVQEGTAFSLFVWKSLTGNPSDLIYERENQTIEATSYFNEFQRIRLPDLIVSDTIYIGWEQLTNDFMAIGYDKQHDFGDRIYYNVESEWIQNDEFHGSLMIRPYFGYLDPTSSVNYDRFDKTEYLVYPNPTDGTFSLKGSFDQLSVYDLMGKEVYQNEGNQKETYDLSHLKNGVYVLRVIYRGKVFTEKIVLKK